MHITIQAMNIFVRSVEKSNFTAAARTLLIDPAVISRTIKALETDLGVLLFARSTRTLKLTAEGARFYRDCVRVLKTFEEATQQFNALRAKPHGQLKVGMGPGLTRRMMLRAIPKFQRLYPEVEIVLLSIDDAAEIGDKGIDVLVRPRSLRQRRGQHPEPQGLVVRNLCRSQYVACASPQYLDHAGIPRAPADLLRHACVALISPEMDILNEWGFTKSNIRQNVKVVPNLLVQGTDALREAALAGCGIIRCLACHVEDELAANKRVHVLTDWECARTRPIIATYRKTRPMLAKISVFVQHLAEEFRRHDAPN
jgi:LysR family transcriptional regulator, regulator for bpeEF and oprC